MRQAGQLVARALVAVHEAVRAGVTTAELDAIAEEVILSGGGKPSFRGVPGIVPGAPPYPAATCISVNEEVVHGIPGDRVLQEGDIVSVDVGAVLDGWHADAAMTFGVGQISARAQRLIEATRTALMLAIGKARPGYRLGDISAAIQAYAEEHGFAVVREYTGHGIGREMWEGFQVPNFGVPGTGLKLRPGMTMAIEPMLIDGSGDTTVRPNGWTVVASDGGLAAHFEHTIAVTEGEPMILTEL